MEKTVTLCDSNRKACLQPFSPSDREIEQIVKQNKKMERMYHYTSMDVFYKLVEGIQDDCFSFRAGSVYTMNDRQEMIIGYEKIKAYLPQVEERLQVTEEEKISKLLLDTQDNHEIADYFGEWMINDDTTNFAISFSASPDILPMWTLYGGTGTGVCLEFSPYIIEKYYEDKEEGKTMQIEHCVYKEADIESFLLEKLEVLYGLYLRSNKDKKTSKVKARHLAVMCGVVGTFVKHPCYEYEQEIRLNTVRNKQSWNFIETRHHNQSVYVDFDIPTSALTGIIVGPATNYDKVKNSIVLMLSAKSLKIEPVHSHVPFRLY